MPKRCRRAIRNSLALLSAALVCCSQKPNSSSSEPERLSSADPVDVCTVLRTPNVYRGRMIAVRGIYWQGLREGCPEIRLGGRSWPAALNLVEAVGKQGPTSALFETDRPSWDTLDRLAIREAKAGRQEEIWATVLGELRAPATYIRDDGTTVGGYGHLGAFPAELIVKQVLATEILSRPTYDYSELLRSGAQ
jgi:hypothetical protein